MELQVFYVIMNFMKTLIAKKIEAAMKAKSLTQTELAKLLEVSQQAVNQWLAGETSPKGKRLIKLSSILGVSVDWLLTGTGTEQAVEPKQNYSDLSPGPNFIRSIPLISWISAGVWCEAIDNYSPGDAEEWLPCATPCSKHTYALRVNGDSMTNPYPSGKTYQEGTIIYVDPEKPVTNGCRVIARLPNKNEATFKQYVEDGGKKFLKPLNPHYPIIEIDENTMICGVIIGSYIPE